MSYDGSCYDLAEGFLSDEPALDSEFRRKQLAQLIQDTIDDYMHALEPKESSCQKSF